MSAWMYFGVPIGCLLISTVIVAIVILRSREDEPEQTPWYHDVDHSDHSYMPAAWQRAAALSAERSRRHRDR